MIPCSNPRSQYLAQKHEIDAAIARVLASDSYILGGEVAAFEQEFARYLGVRHAIGVASGTDALELALRALDIGDGEVVTTPLTATATIAAIVAAGATPVVVDVRRETLTVDPAEVERAIRGRTRAIVPVHLYGGPADIEAIMALAKRHGLAVIEDCAQSAGAKVRGRQTGTFGDIGCFSFYPTKNLGAIGDGGIVVTSRDDLAERLRRLRQYGWDSQRVSAEPGVNSRLDEIQAAVLRVKLPRLDADNERRGQIAARYERGLVDTGLVLPMTAASCTHVYHLYVVRTRRRAALMAALEARDIRAGIHYAVPAHRDPGYAGAIGTHGSLAAAEEAAESVVSLPMYPQLTDGEVDRVIEAVRAFAPARAVA